MRKYRHGFTLTEILLVSCMFAVISIAVFNAFSNGFKLWARGERVLVEGNVAIFLDRMAEDLRQTVTITGIPFIGDSSQISFPAIIMATTDGSRAQEGNGPQIGAIVYNLDAAQKKIFRAQATYGQALRKEWSDPIEVASDIESISMQYYFQANPGLDVKSQTDQGIPLGVMIDVEYFVDGQEFHMKRFMIIPVGGAI